jgi:hypothetical protein
MSSSNVENRTASGILHTWNQATQRASAVPTHEEITDPNAITPGPGTTAGPSLPGPATERTHT